MYQLFSLLDSALLNPIFVKGMKESDQYGLMARERIASQARRVVIKLGTAVLIGEANGIAHSRLYSLVESIAELKRAGREVLIVSSGAIGLGAERLKLERRPQVLPLKQACAAVGQGRLMSLYSEMFELHGIVTAQVLLTAEDFSSRRRYLNLRSTITKLLELGTIPIINENDTVSTAEIESRDASSMVKINFGDNDKLSALVASKIEADLLVLLTDVEGLYTANPHEVQGAKLIPLVREITPEIEALAVTGGARETSVGRGGIGSKLEAARIAIHSGCATIIGGGKLPGIIDRIFAGEDVGTLFLPRVRYARHALPAALSPQLAPSTYASMRASSSASTAAARARQSAKKRTRAHPTRQQPTC